MSTAAISVAFVNQPKEGKTKGSIKTNEGEYYEVFPNQLGLFRPGASYEIDYSERNWNGKTYRTINKCRPQEKPAVVRSTDTAAAPDANQEFEFVSRVLSASIQACAVTYTQEGLTDAVRMLRQAYRNGMR
jgi:hypothetical protein